MARKKTEKKKSAQTAPKVHTVGAYWVGPPTPRSEPQTYVPSATPDFPHTYGDGETIAVTNITTVPIPLTRVRVAIVGFASNTRDLAPYQDTAWEIWGLNNLYKFLPRWDRWFEQHDPAQIEALYGPDYVAFLKSVVGKPVYMQKHLAEYPASVEFPRAELAKKVQGGREFWPSSISYMLALAIDELTDPATGRARAGAEIGLYGIDLLGDDEYSFQREGCGFLVGVAEGRGIKVTIPPAASLLKHAYMYGYEVGEHSPDQYEVYLASQAQMYGQKRMEALAQAQTFDGAMQGFQTALTMYRHQKRGGALAQPETKPAEAKAA